jgi:ankyrin repeat protein
MRTLKIQTVLAQLLAILVLLATSGFGPEPRVSSPISADEFVRAMTAQRTSVLDLYFSQHLNPNARASQDRPLLLAATLQQDGPTVNRLLQAGASVDLADEVGLTPLMAAAMQGNLEFVREFVGGVTNINATDRSGRTALQYAVAAQKTEVIQLMLRLMSDLANQSGDLVATALDTGNRQIIDLIFGRVPSAREWTTKTRKALDASLSAGNSEQVKLLLSKHAVQPTPEGKNVPLLAYTIASNNMAAFKMLLAGGADPNTMLPDKCDKDFLDSLSSRSFRSYVEDDKGVTALMLAAGLGQTDYVRALLEGGADRTRATGHCRMLALYLAAQTGSWQCTQLLLGSGPPPEQLRIEISLASQKAAVLRDGVPIFSTSCSTGRQGYSTRTGDYVITDKERSHRSTIYKVEMPYFMRLSCLDFGMHEGVVPSYPASHGCIRLPGDAARRLFAEIPVGTLVSVK